MPDVYAEVFERYGEHSPTPFDQHISFDDERESWYVMPVSHNRDSEPHQQSNFFCFLKELGGEGDDVEVHRFGHWGPGWYEIILVRPGAKCLETAYDMARGLEDYPVLDEEDLSAREMEDIDESWDSFGSSEWLKEAERLLESEMTSEDCEDLADPYQRWCKNWGLAIDICGCGDCLETREEWFASLIERLGQVDDYRALAKACGMKEEYCEGRSPFTFNLELDTLVDELTDAAVTT